MDEISFIEDKINFVSFMEGKFDTFKDLHSDKYRLLTVIRGNHDEAEAISTVYSFVAKFISDVGKSLSNSDYKWVREENVTSCFQCDEVIQSRLFMLLRDMGTS